MKHSSKTRNTILAVVVLLVVFSSMFVLAACKKDKGPGSGKTYDNENDPLIFSTQEVDKVFNPFFSTSAMDSNVVGMTQISMLTNDKDGNPEYGDDKPVVVKDMEILTYDENMEILSDLSPNSQKRPAATEYRFVIKNGIKFSNGSDLTIKDVLFNLYVYLDPAYTGSSTIYSTEIVGLKEYRTQSDTEEGQKAFEAQFRTEATARITNLASAANEILKAHKDDADFDDAKFKEYLAEKAQTNPKAYGKLVKDYEKAKELFREELESDYSSARDTYTDVKFRGEDGILYENLFTTDVEVFLLNEGYIKWEKKNNKLTSTLVNDVTKLKDWTKEQAIETVFIDKIPASIEEIITFWATATTLNDYIALEAQEEYFAGETTQRQFKNISGIKFLNKDNVATVNGVDYNNRENGGNDVLSITIKNVDPKAIWNFAFAVAPMYYYSDAAHIAAFDFESNFGVEYASPSFMSKVVKNPDKIGVPMGAGAYAASKSSGGLENIGSGDFYSLGVIYFERNPYYVMGPATIKKVRFKVVSSTQILNSLYSGEIDFAEPNAKPETIKELDGKKSDGIGNKSIVTSGYGYIGINAGKVPNIYVRQAIMHSVNTLECVAYYKGAAKAIYRSMSLSNWAYPGKTEGTRTPTAYYPYIGGAIPENLNDVNPEYAAFVAEKEYKPGQTMTQAHQDEFIRYLVETLGGYTLDGSGVYAKNDGKERLSYVFTIAGEETDHPAFSAMNHACERLNKLGFNVEAKTDANALKKLSTGDLAVWAAAWGSTIDPDMYQVYHKDSKATSVLNWGYKQILVNAGGKYDTELGIVEQLSELIEKARQTNVKKERAAFYEEALNLVMQLAVELPTYQRDDLFAYNENKIDVSTFTPESQLSPFKGLTSDLDKVSLRTK